MFCKNCGSNVDGMNFCNKCGTKVENTDIEMTKKTESKSIDGNEKDLKIMGYILAFLPLLGLITMWIPDDIYTFISPAIIGLNIGLWYADKTLLRKHRYTGKWTWWGIVLIPIYLYFRCRKTNEKYSKLILNIVSIVLVIVIAFIPLNFNNQDYTENYEWWLNHSVSYDKDTFGTMAADYNATFVSDKNEYIKLYAYENRDGSMQLNFNILITGTGEEMQILGTDSYQVEYSITDNKHCWTYKTLDSMSDKVIITYIAEDKTLNVTSSAELLGVSEYSHIITGVYKPVKGN